MLFLRLSSKQWSDRPALGNPIFASEMHRLERPRTQNRLAFLLTFVKEDAAQLAVQLSSTLSAQMTFAELVHEVLPPLCASSFFIANDADSEWRLSSCIAPVTHAAFRAAAAPAGAAQVQRGPRLSLVSACHAALLNLPPLLISLRPPPPRLV